MLYTTYNIGEPRINKKISTRNIKSACAIYELKFTFLVNTSRNSLQHSTSLRFEIHITNERLFKLRVKLTTHLADYCIPTIVSMQGFLVNLPYRMSCPLPLEHLQQDIRIFNKAPEIIFAVRGYLNGWPWKFDDCLKIEAYSWICPK